MKYNIAFVILMTGLCSCKSPNTASPQIDHHVTNIAVAVETNIPPPNIRIASELAEQIAEQLPRKFVGTFTWTQREGSGWASPNDFATLHIDSVNATDDMVYFRGSHIYEPGRRVFEAVGHIDSISYKFVMLESKPGGPVEHVGPNLVSVAITDGSFNGNISKELSAIDAIWTTNGRNMTGVLTLKATQ